MAGRNGDQKSFHFPVLTTSSPDAELVHQPLEIELHGNDPDGTGDAGGIGNDGVPRLGHIVAPGGRQSLETNYHRHAFFGLERLEFVQDDIRGGHGASGGINFQDHCLDAVILGGFFQFFLDPAGRGHAAGQPEYAVWPFQDHPGDVHEQDLVPAVSRNGFLL